MKDWLASEKSATAPKSEKFEIYSPDKIMTFDDLVWLAIQESPIISSGSINLEISEISKRDAKWQYLPEMHLTYHITNNLTKYNEGTRYATRNYGETTYELTFNGVYRNPVSTYFSVKAQDELLQTAIITQRKAIANVIYEIASNLLDIYLQEKNIGLIERQIAENQLQREASEIRSRHASESVTAKRLESSEAALDLQLQEAQLELRVARSRLKRLVGLDMKLALKVDAKSVFPLLDQFHPDELNWRECWDRSEDRYILDQRANLEQANVYLAWASYLPNININLNESPGKGQSQPASAQSDQFLHLTLNFPLLDWGRRWRQADMASLRQRQRKLDAIQAAREYEQDWDQWEQKVELERVRLARREKIAQSAARLVEEMEIAYKHGKIGIDALAGQRNQELVEELAVNTAENKLAMTRLSWMHFASGLSTHFLGNAGYKKDKK